jgi:hypothetical protein
LADFNHLIGVKVVRARKGHASFIAAPPKHLGHAVKRAVDTLFTAQDRRTLHVGDFGDLFGQGVVPKLPAQPEGEFPRDLAAAASVFPFYCDDSIQKALR